MQNLLNNKLVLVAGGLLIGLLAGYLFFRDGGEHAHSQEGTSAETNTTPTEWTCAMHPQIRQSEPGKCPLCGMDLSPLGEVSEDPMVLEMSETAAQLAGIRTQKLEYAEPNREIFMQGKVEADERNLSLITSRFSGRIERLNIDFTGAEVQKGQVLATVYSPELINAQKELLEAAKYKEVNPELYRAARNKLKLWDLSEERIREIESGGEPQTTLPITSPASGVVTRREVTAGAYVKEGTPLFEVLDLSRVWVIFDAYEQDLPWLNVGDEVTFEVQSLPGKKFSSRISFIDPILDARTRTARIRTESPNPGRKLKPGMFGSGNMQASLDLKEKKLTLPRSAVLWTGKRSVVWVRLPGTNAPVFQFREVTLGPELGNRFLVESGLDSGEEVVIQGAFSVDAAAQLAGKYSMMNRPEEVIQPEQIEISEAFRTELGSLLEAYFELKNALIESDPASSAKGVTSMKQTLARTRRDPGSEKAEEVWKTLAQKMEESLAAMGSEDLEGMRTSFSPLSDALGQAIEVFGAVAPVIYKDYCPMANRDQGAFWLSETKEIRNPYFGESMLKCGEVRQVWKSPSD